MGNKQGKNQERLTEPEKINHNRRHVAADRAATLCIRGTFSYLFWPDVRKTKS